MRTGSGLFLLGILTLVWIGKLPALLPAVISCLLLTLLCVRYRTLRLFLWYGAGVLWSLYCATTLLKQGLQIELEGQSLIVHGHVTSLPERNEHFLQFDFRIERMFDQAGNPHPGPDKVRLNWYRPYPEIRAGQALALEVRLKRPHGYRNPHGFDYEAWLFQQRIRAAGYVRKLREEEPQVKPFISMHVLRQTMHDRILRYLDPAGNGALVFALAIGDQSGIGKDQWQVLTETGTGHLLSISGLHIGLTAAFGYLITRWTWPMSATATCRVPAPRAACLASLLSAVIYALLAGFTIPVQRSLVMVTAFALPGITDRRIPAADSYAYALLTVLILDPMAVLSTGFWLSFGTVLIILVTPVPLRSTRLLPLLTGWFRMQLFIFIGLIVILAVWFNQVALSGLIANMIAIPWVSFVTVPVVLCAMVLLVVYEPAGAVLLGMGQTTLDLLWPLLEYLAGIDALLVPVAKPSYAIAGAALAGTAMIFLPAGMPVRGIGLFWLLPLFFTRPVLPPAGEFEAVVLDVGQGLSVVIRTRSHVLLYDTGPGFTTGFNAGWAVVIPFLRGEGISRIDLLIQSHGDNDHIGGLPDVLANIKTAMVISSVSDHIPHERVIPCRGGQKWQWDGVAFEMLSPADGSTLSGNNASCVLRIANNSQSILLTGDIEKRAEEDLLRYHTENLSSTVLIAPHHGSLTSSTPGFVREVAPEHVIFSAGFLNRFRLPKQDIINRYEMTGSRILNTAHDGAIRIRFGNDGVRITSERAMASRFWNFSQ